MLAIGLLGINRIESEIITLLKKSSVFKITGIFSHNYFECKKIAQKFEIHHFTSPEEIIENAAIFYQIDNVKEYFDILIEGLKNGKHLFIENIGEQSVEDLSDLIKIAEESNSVIQFRKKNVYTPSFLSLKEKIKNPQLIEIDQKINETEISTNSLIFNYIIYDIDLISTLFKSEIRRISATGFSIFNNNIDLILSRIEFSNGCIINIKLENTNHTESLLINVYEHHKIYKLDISNNKYSIIKNRNNFNNKFEKSAIKKTDAINFQFNDFYKLIINHQSSFYNLHDNYWALNLSNKITELVKSIENKKILGEFE